ncbi:MAG: PEP-CTERM sorting domain-containing protein [Acidobacteria bacterium]|nr:MAG: PEP-CTERM sorting domain-containing protein [Acidobacteriota bacterium]
MGVIVRTTVLACALLLSQRAGEPASAAKTLLSHDFSTSPQGWLIAGDTSDVAADFKPAGGNPGGYISHVDEALGETWYFRAPATVLAELAAAQHGALSFDLKQSSTDAGFPDDDVVIVGAAGRLSYRFDRAPGTAWTSFSVPLSASAGWRWNWNQVPTEEQMRQVLAAPTRLDIRGEFRTGDDTGGLDNFQLTSGNRTR